MSLMNVNLAVLAYQDGPATLQPKIKLADVQWSLLGIPTNNLKNIPISLAPGELLTIASTVRTLSYSGSTNFVVTKSGADRMRITAAIGQRTARAYGDSTTAWTVTKFTDYVRLTSTAGTAPDFTTMNPGDSVYLGLTYSPFNQGEFQLIRRGSNFVDFVNPIGTSEGPILGDLNIYSSGPIQKGDVLDITDPSFSIVNRGQFPVVLATDSFIEVLNQTAYAETITSITSGVNIYAFAYKWMLAVVDRQTYLGLNGNTPDNTLIVEPSSEGDLVNSPGLMLKQGKVFEVQIFNPTQQLAEGFLILAE